MIFLQMVNPPHSAYRSETSRKGWTTEADLPEGETRIDKGVLYKLIHSTGARFLKYVNEQNLLEGCVFLQKKETKLYLGMLSVSPDLQSRGIGKALMHAASGYAKEQGCQSVFIKVISVRHELIDWYLRQGFVKTGESEPFPADNRFGTPTQPLEFIIMEKNL